MLWLVGLGLALDPTTLPVKCLDNPIPANMTRKLEYGNVSTPLRVLAGSWDAGMMINAIGAILLKEAVGVEVEWGRHVPGSAQVVVAMSGCPDPTESITKCLARPKEDLIVHDPYGHVA